MAEFRSSRYIPGTPGYTKTGFKKGAKLPYGAQGSNGTFHIPGDPPRLLLAFALEDGSSQCYDVRKQLKESTGRKVSEKKFNKLVENLTAACDVEVKLNDDGVITKICDFDNYI